MASEIQDVSAATSISISNDALARAAESRNQNSSQKQREAAKRLADSERRQAFRRLIDPGIMRPNSKEQANASLKTLLTIAENLLNDLDNPKFQQFKPTNTIIKKNLVDTKGALEYAIELGFRPEIKDFQPYYTFNPKRMDDLQIGAEIIREAFDRESKKLERAARAKKEEKAAISAAAEKVKLAFLDDRRSKELWDERERERRAAHATSSTSSVRQTENSGEDSDPESVQMPGTGQALASPPPYEAPLDDKADKDD